MLSKSELTVHNRRRTGRKKVDCIVGDLLADVPAVHADPLVPTVFHSEWWLNAATGGGWEEARLQSGGRTVGRFPYVVSRVSAGHTVCAMPPLTHFLGPAIDEGSGSACNRALKRAQVTRDLLDRMPKSSGFYQKMSRAVPETLVFQELGYATGVQFTYEIAPDAAPNLWKRMRDKTRNVIRRAEEAFTVDQLHDPEAFAAFYHRNLQQKNLPSHYESALLVGLCGEAMRRGQGQILAARDATGALAAAIVCVSDAVSTYYLLTTRTQEAGNGAVALLLWTAIRESAARGLIFDFDGVGMEGSRVFYTGFGGMTEPRYTVSRFSLGHRIAGRLSNPFRRKAKATFY